MKTLPKLVIFFGLVGIGVFGLKTAVNHGFGMKILSAVIPQKMQLPEVKDAVVANVIPSAYPSAIPDGCDDPIRSEVWAWNSQIAYLYSNGGIDTTKGSLIEKHNACMHFTRQDDTGQMHTDLITCANDLKKSTECTGGQQFITIMMNGSEQFIAQFNAEAKKICADCTAEIVSTTGYSRGEDGFWGPAAWKRNPRSALGDGLIAVVLRDGDWDIIMKWAGDNGLRVNPDEHTFDPDALNVVNVAKFTDAPERYISNYSESRKVVVHGSLTGESRDVPVKGYSTWTPGDVTGAEKKGGLERIVSTKEYRSQMPSAVIGIKKWDRAHPDKVAAMIAATLEAGDQVKAFPEALKRAADISAKVYGEQNGAYWLKYYKGISERDKTGQIVELGGSYASNLNDALSLFGVLPGSNNNAKATYTISAKYDMQQYGDLFKNTPIPPFDQVATTNYLLQAKAMIDDPGSAPDKQQYSATSEPGQSIGDKNYDIEYVTNSSTLTSQGMDIVRQIKDDTAITGLTITLNGYTDNTGNALHNQTLSEARAESVRAALQKLAPTDFPEARFRIHGYGQDRPIADNGTGDGRAKNRRVQVILTSQDPNP